jgi:thiol-disulfide isomerase/thioredoxin
VRPRFTALAAGIVAAACLVSVGLALRLGSSAEQVQRLVGAPVPRVVPTEDASPAPELEGITAWINSPPLTMESLRGKVVLIDFWTYTCVNCRRTFPFLRRLHDVYKDDGLVVIGVHSPEFDFEKQHANVARAVRDLRVTWPVAEDPEMATWQAYGNEYWPADYLVDRQGRLRLYHFGEGGEGHIEDGVRRLLDEGGSAGLDRVGEVPTDERPGAGITPELYLGARRGAPYLAAPGTVDEGSRVRRTDRGDRRDQVYLTGEFSGGLEHLQAERGALIDLRVRARDVYTTVAPGPAPGVIEVLLDGAPVPRARRGRHVRQLADGRTVVDVDADDLRHLLTGRSVVESRLRLVVLDQPVRLFTFTFGA